MDPLSSAAAGTKEERKWLSCFFALKLDANWNLHIAGRNKMLTQNWYMCCYSLLTMTCILGHFTEQCLYSFYSPPPCSQTQCCTLHSVCYKLMIASSENMVISLIMCKTDATYNVKLTKETFDPCKL